MNGDVTCFLYFFTHSVNERGRSLFPLLLYSFSEWTGTELVSLTSLLIQWMNGDGACFLYFFTHSVNERGRSLFPLLLYSFSEWTGTELVSCTSLLIQWMNGDGACFLYFFTHSVNERGRNLFLGGTFRTMYLLTRVPVKGRGKRALIFRACHTSKSKISQTESPENRGKQRNKKKRGQSVIHKKTKNASRENSLQRHKTWRTRHVTGPFVLKMQASGMPLMQCANQGAVIPCC